MVYCQQCGAENTDNARFCNMCGAQIASPGEPGGPLPVPATDRTSETLPGHDVAAEAKDSTPPADPGRTVVGHGAAVAAPPAGKKTTKKKKSPPVEPPASAPVEPTRRSDPPLPAAYGSDSLANAPSPLSPSQGGFDVSTMSLQAMGVRSRGSAWATLLGVAALLIGMGAFGAWFLMRGEAENEGDAVASTDEVTPAPEEPEGEGEDVLLGDPVPGGEDIPETIPGHPETTPPARRRGRRTSQTGRRASTGSRGSTGSGSAGGNQGGTTGGGSTGGSSTGGGSTGGTGGGSEGGGSTGGAEGGGSTGGGGGSTGGSEGGGSEGGGSEGGGSTGGSEGGSTGGSGRNWEELEEELEPERDLEMELYANRIRSFIRSYYIRRASTCFDRASRNTQEMVRGTVVIGFEIASSGDVGDTSVVRNTTNDDAVGTCLARQVDSWRLPAPPDGRAPLSMQMPFSQ